jgi:uncharacterized membrane protein YjgN (DUF898 family)
MENLTCGTCGLVIGDGEKRDNVCPRCGSSLTDSRQTGDAGAAGGGFGGGGAAAGAEAVPEAQGPETYRLEFTGTAKEYFRIWIVNTFLTVITLGIYAAWARVRTRTYFYNNTRIGGHPFHFLGTPSAILKGNIIIGAGILIYTLIRNFSPAYAGILGTVFYIITPFFIYKSMRFNTRYAAFRNIRFRFRGTLGQSYIIFLLFPFLIPLTLGIIVPYWEFRRKRYFFDNLGYGTADARFDGRPGFFYGTYVKVAVVGAALLLLFLLLTGVWSPFIRFPRRTFPFEIIAVWFVVLCVSAYMQQYLYARLANYCWSQTTVEGVSFESTLAAAPLAWIRITNILAIVATVGLLIPWAKVRRTRYFAEHFTVTTREGLDGFTARSEPEVSAVGDAATDFFDIGFGL